MYYRADIKDGKLLSVVRDIMDLCGLTECGRESGDVLMLCDAENAHKYASVYRCIVLWRDESFLHSDGYKQLQESGKFTYLRVPFSIEMLAHIIKDYQGEHMIAKEAESAESKPQLTRDGVIISYGDGSVVLTERELELFEYLYARLGKVVSRADILRDVWQSDTESNIVDVYVSYLRRKLDSILPKGSLTSVRGSGYVLRI